MKHLFLIRGLPGSGKTTLAEDLTRGSGTGHGYKDGGVAVEADDFFMNENGNYHFNPKKLPEAHAHCQEECRRAMSNGNKRVAVANTFSMKWETEPYFELAKKYNYSVFIIECQNTFENTHNVPTKTINAMKERWENIL